jgi:putative ABC transport system permease protein
MYVTVAERTREVGLRKAVGATNRNIRNQFLFESAILSISGGIIGLLISLVSILIVRNFFPAHLTIWSVLLALGVSTLVGIIFGLAPARKASKLTPVEALRYE